MEAPSARKSAGCWGREEVGALAFIPEVPTRVLTSTTGSSDKPLHMTAPEPFTKTAASTCRPTPAKGVRVDGAAPASVTRPASLQRPPAAGTTKPLLSPRRVHAALSSLHLRPLTQLGSPSTHLPSAPVFPAAALVKHTLKTSRPT